MRKYKKTLRQEFSDAESNMTHFHSHWNLLLEIAYARLTTTKGFQSRVREGSLSSLIWERSARVVAQIPSGVFRALTKKNSGMGELANKMWNRYIIPNANTDYSFKTKLRLWDYYSLIYGAMPKFYDWRTDDEYVGPDTMLLDPRHCFPYGGRGSLHSCPKVFVETFHGPDWFESKLGKPDWNQDAIKKLLELYDADATPTSQATDTPLQQDRAEDKKGTIRVVTCYERGKKGKWTTFAADYDEGEVPNLREIANPHENGRIPVVFKYAMPLIDSLWGMGDVERGASLQRAIDTAINLGLDFSKFKLFPPMWYTDGINRSSLRYEPNAKWKLPGRWGEVAGYAAAGGESSNEQQLVYQFLKGALLNQNGTTDTTISATDKMPGFGRTKQAIEKLERRENARDQWDRDMFEEAYTDLANGMLNLAVSKQATPIDFHIFDEDIFELISAGHRDIIELYDSAVVEYRENGELKRKLNDTHRGEAVVHLPASKIKTKYLFQMDAHSSATNDEAEEFERVAGTIEFLATPAGRFMTTAAQQQGMNVDYKELLNQYFVASGIRNREKIYSVSATPQQNGPVDFNVDMLQDQALRSAAEGAM